ncbi:hypothetical protein [Aurantiacibacter gangjinensis]|uniref:Uncharacterized protein n=1 Tax=Aurantiacibacter gangjinensis TaxID=502682 RepID=A0A0G9MML5_9SPHN|nr:hypothetical protein [Aurantiacibacter gangjinensis]APE27891.1 hypothetical protein BMF35_a1062 [Aurantiacibacter gangjinensis]KLE31854.1 hypothetical protein AAW01_10280 [Aurantiacibacter gangjinensis]
MRSTKTIFYELNEVPRRVFEHFAAQPGYGAFARLAKHARKYETMAEDTGHLSPWITWPTLHRGVTNEMHEISDFGMDLSAVNREVPPVWSLLQKAGRKVGLFGSLHSYPMPADASDYAFYVPDTFAAGPETFPKKFESFQRFNIAMVEQNAMNVKRGLPLRDAATFLRNAPGLGLAPRTVAKLAGQLASERVNKDRVVRRRSSQAQLAFDFFFKALKQEKPDASFFFTNHVASSMHRYWPSLFPADYEAGRFPEEWTKQWGGEIPFAMKEANDQIARLLDLCDRTGEFQLVVTTSMGQEAVEERAPVTSAVTISNMARLMDGLGLSREDWERRPSMAPQYNVHVKDGAKQQLIQRLGGLDISGHHIDVQDLGNNILRLELKAENLETLDVQLQGDAVDAESIGITNMHLQDAAGANAYHIPQGLMLIYDPQDRATRPDFESHGISTREIAPSILQAFNVERPGYMSAGQGL